MHVNKKRYYPAIKNKFLEIISFSKIKKIKLMENEFTPDLQRQIFKSIFQTEGSQICFCPEILETNQGVKGLCNPCFHTPIQQLFEFYHRWGGLHPVPPIPQKKPSLIETKGGVKIYDELIGSPLDLFVSLDGTGVETNIYRITSRGKTAALLGAMSVPSMYDVIVWLRNNQFMGELFIYDICPVPLRIGQIYNKLGLLGKTPIIQFINETALNIGELGEVDIVVSDVLGYYLCPDDYKNLIRAINQSLNNGGVWVTRELIEPYGMPPPNQRTVRGDIGGKLADFGQFIQKTTGVKLPKKELRLWFERRWKKVVTYPRKSIEEYIGEQEIPQRLSLAACIKTSSTFLFNQNLPRIFATLVFRKKN